MIDQLISFDVAVLAKKKGFNWKTPSWYNQYGYLLNKSVEPDNDGNTVSISDIVNLDLSSVIFYESPTQSLLQRWLRETHSIEVPVIFFDRGYLYAVTKKPAKGNHYRVEYSNTYEEALEKGLFEALNLLPNIKAS